VPVRRRLVAWSGRRATKPYPEWLKWLGLLRSGGEADEPITSLVRIRRCHGRRSWSKWGPFLRGCPRSFVGTRGRGQVRLAPQLEMAAIHARLGLFERAKDPNALDDSSMQRDQLGARCSQVVARVLMQACNIRGSQPVLSQTKQLSPTKVMPMLKPPSLRHQDTWFPEA
jgi:hypothetical protein